LVVAAVEIAMLALADLARSLSVTHNLPTLLHQSLDLPLLQYLVVIEFTDGPVQVQLHFNFQGITT
jgi:hypothetical protein